MTVQYFSNTHKMITLKIPHYLWAASGFSISKGLASFSMMSFVSKLFNYIKTLTTNNDKHGKKIENFIPEKDS